MRRRGGRSSDAGVEPRVMQQGAATEVAAPCFFCLKPDRAGSLFEGDHEGGEAHAEAERDADALAQAF